MSIEQQLGDALKREVSGAYNSLTFGEGVLRAIIGIAVLEMRELCVERKS